MFIAWILLKPLEIPQIRIIIVIKFNLLSTRNQILFSFRRRLSHSETKTISNCIGMGIKDSLYSHKLESQNKRNAESGMETLSAINLECKLRNESNSYKILNSKESHRNVLHLCYRVFFAMCEQCYSMSTRRITRGTMPLKTNTNTSRNEIYRWFWTQIAFHCHKLHEALIVANDCSESASYRKMLSYKKTCIDSLIFIWKLAEESMINDLDLWE